VSDVLDRLRGGLVVSCQARGDNPLRHTPTIVRMCRATLAGGAVAVRVEGLEDVAAVSDAIDAPVIGLWKVGSQGVFITPGVGHALAVAGAGADIVAVDGTRRSRPDGSTLVDVTVAVHDRTDALVLADVADRADAEQAIDAGVDVLATTLSGYTDPDADVPAAPDLDLVEELVGLGGVPVIAEGRYHRPDDVARALSMGAHAVVVGTAITDLRWATGRFVQALMDAHQASDA
jgi:N-acylglucosamine-6-phosphate 2-epimerase